MGYSFTSTSEKAETFIENISTPVKPYLPAISRFLIVATFFEDGIRILVQWSDQIDYLKNSRHFNYYLATLFLGFNAIVSCFSLWEICLMG
jgi:hypothetical protein